MADNNDYRKNYLRDSSLFNVTDPEDSELAYQLQNIQINDLGVFRKLIYRYGPNLYAWIDAMLTHEIHAQPGRNEVWELVRETFTQAVQEVEHFHGEVSVADWLFSLSYRVIKKSKDKYRINRSTRNIKSSNWIRNQAELDPDLWQKLVSLPLDLYLPVILRYVFDLGIADIARIFNLHAKEAQRRLMKGRSQLMEQPIKSHKASQIQAYLDCVLDQDQDEIIQLEQHIMGCDQCQETMVQLKETETKLSTEFKKIWSIRDISQDEAEALLESISDSLHNKPRKSMTSNIFHHSAWLIGFSIVFIIFAVIFIRLTPVEKDIPQLKPTATPALPAIIQMNPAGNQPNSTSDSPISPRYVEPDFSNDGNWIVYSSLQADPVTGLLLLPTIELVDRSSNTLNVIRKGSGNLNALWSVWDMAPSISGDGRWIAFVGSGDGLGGMDGACQSDLKLTCTDIFLYNRVSGTTKQITHSSDGSPSNGTSISPAISSDGNWIAFWSTATNLVQGDDITCQPENPPPACLHVYYYNRVTGLMSRIPTNTNIGESGITTGPISLSADGSLIGFTITVRSEQTQTISSGGFNYNILGNLVTRTQHYRSYDYYDLTTDAIVFDRKSNKLEIENRTPDGKLGNGSSSTPMLSADGHFVAFTSGSNNLVDGDNNNSIDVFVRDRETGKVELASINSAGEQGNGDSGFTEWRRGYNSLDISADGRYVVFTSTAPNLGQRLSSDCYIYQDGNCILLYLHDRQTNQTQVINTLPYGDFLRYPKISSDGRYISFMLSKYRCSSSQDFCSNVMLYDRYQNWLSNLTDFGEVIPELGWTYSSKIEIPWEGWESSAIAFSPDGQFVGLGGMDSKIRLWQVADNGNPVDSKEPVFTLDTKKGDVFNQIEFSNDGSMIAAGTTEGMVYIWGLPQANLLYSLDQQPGFIKNLVFSKDNSNLVISTTDNTSIWQFQAEKLIQVEMDNQSANVEVSPAGNMMAINNDDGTILVKSLLDGLILGRLQNGNSPNYDLAFSDDGTLLAVRSVDGNVGIFRISLTVSDDTQITPITSIQSLGLNGQMVFSPDDQYLTTTGNFGEIDLWSIPAGVMYAVTPSVPNKSVNSLVFSKSGDKMAAVVENEIIIWNVPVHASTNYFQPVLSSKVDPNPFNPSTANDLPNLPTSNSSDSNHLTLDQAAERLKFQPLVPENLPENYEYQESRVNQDGSVLLVYSASSVNGFDMSLYIYEKVISSLYIPKMTIGGDSLVIPTAFWTNAGYRIGEYVAGDWSYMRSFTLPSDRTGWGEVHDIWAWDNTSASQRLRWEQDGLLIGLYYQVNDPYIAVLPNLNNNGAFSTVSSALNKTDLVQIASDMKQYFDVIPHSLNHRPSESSQTTNRLTQGE